LVGGGHIGFPVGKDSACFEKKRAAQIQVVLMDVDGTITDGAVTPAFPADGTAIEIKSLTPMTGKDDAGGERPGCGSA